MILTVLIGNTNTRLTWFEKNRIVRRQIIPTATFNPSSLFNPRSPLSLKGAALASVVPKLTRPVYQVLCDHTPTLLLTAKTPTPLKFHYNRSLLGADRVCVAVGGYLCFPGNLIIIDFGTAITVNVVHKEGVFFGGPILPGAELILSSLNEKTSQLPRVTFASRKNPLNFNTRWAIQSGAFNLITGGLNQIIQKVRSRTKRKYLIIATGGSARQFHRHIKGVKIVDKDLASRGLAQIFYFNYKNGGNYE